MMLQKKKTKIALMRPSYIKFFIFFNLFEVIRFSFVAIVHPQAIQYVQTWFQKSWDTVQIVNKKGMQ